MASKSRTDTIQMEQVVGKSRHRYMQKILLARAGFFVAGAEGIGPTLEVLETPVLPLYYAPPCREPPYAKVLFGHSVQSKPY